MYITGEKDRMRTKMFVFVVAGFLVTIVLGIAIVAILSKPWTPDPNLMPTPSAFETQISFVCIVTHNVLMGVSHV